MASSATRTPKPAPRSQTQKKADHAAHMVRVKDHLAEQHTGPDCPREPADQFRAPGVWLRATMMHINCGGGEHLYTFRYECSKCHAVTTVEQ